MSGQHNRHNFPFFFPRSPAISAEILADILLTEVVAVQLWSPVQGSPLWLILEEPHGVDVLEEGRGEKVSEACLMTCS